MLTRIRRVVLVGHDNEGSADIFSHITRSFPECEFLLVVGQGLYYRKSFVASVIKLLREASWLFVAHRFVELVKFQLRGDTLVRRARQSGVQIMYTRDINSEETMAQLRDFAPDLLVSLFTMQVYRAPVLSIARFGSISSHPSILPKYRGLEVFFWVLANEEKETGVSVFFLNDRIDAGRVFRQRVVPIGPETTVRSLYKEITHIGAHLLVEAMRDIDQDNVASIASDGEGSYYRMPDRASVRRFRRAGRRF